MSVLRNLKLSAILLLAMPMTSLANDWQVGVGIKVDGRSVGGQLNVNDDNSSFTLPIDTGSVFGPELSVSRVFWKHWRLTGYYAYLSAEDRVREELLVEGEPQVLKVDAKAQEQQLGASMQRLFHWGERWSPYLGLGVVYSRFDEDFRLRILELDEAESSTETDWLYAGVAGIEYRFTQSYSAELEYQYIALFDGDIEDGASALTLRLGYRF